VRGFLDGIKSTRPASGFDEVLVPGDFEYRSRTRRLAEGIEVPEMIHRQLHEWGERLNVALGEEIVEAEDGARYRS
jgi:LDH2 family malate/lactate/ureidoglycolate dehydrogenase